MFLHAREHGCEAEMERWGVGVGVGAEGGGLRSQCMYVPTCT